MSRRILIVDDQPLVREGLRSLLSREGFDIVAEVASVSEALAAAASRQPDVVLFDPSVPNAGSGLCGELRRRAPTAALVVLSTRRDASTVRDALEAGARGFVLKDSDAFHLPDVINRVLKGETVIDGRVADTLENGDGESPTGPRLSERELDVLRLVAQGLTNAEIGKRLYLSRHTVKEYLSQVMRKLGATNRLEAVLLATGCGLIEPQGDLGEDHLDRHLHGLVRDIVVETRPSCLPAGVRDEDLSVPPIKLRERASNGRRYAKRSDER
jgi:two-component system, NarL family, response regulator DevR